MSGDFPCETCHKEIWAARELLTTAAFTSLQIVCVALFSAKVVVESQQVIYLQLLCLLENVLLLLLTKLLFSQMILLFEWMFMVSQTSHITFVGQISSQSIKTVIHRLTWC